MDRKIYDRVGGCPGAVIAFDRPRFPHPVAGMSHVIGKAMAQRPIRQAPSTMTKAQTSGGFVWGG